MTDRTIEALPSPDGLDRGPPFAPKLRASSLRSDVIDRPRILDRLEQSDTRLVVIAAPAGFGKSTLLAQWEARESRRFAFVTLEPSENDPLELWNCIVYSLRQIEPSFGDDVEAMLRSVGDIALDSLVRRVAIDLEALSQPVVVVLDDYHVIKNPACHASVEALIAHPVSKLRTVVSSRSDPAIPLGRLRAAGELLEIRGSELAFTADETRELLNDVAGLNLVGDELPLLHDRTEGWPAGLQLASLGLRTTAERKSFLLSFGGSYRHVADYLTEVVLDAVDDDVRQFLLETSVLNGFSSSLCDAVTGRHDSAAMLERLERINVFLIPLDDQRLWYRYHHLMAGLLQEQLSLRRPGRGADLHRAASAWFATAGDVDQAVEHANAAAEFGAASDLVLEHWESRFISGRFTTILAWLESFPDGYVSSSASLSLVKAWVTGVLGHETQARKSIEDIHRSGFDGRLPDGSSSVDHAAALIRSMLPWTNVRELREAAGAVQGFYEELPPRSRAMATFAVGLAAFLGGENDTAQVELQRARELAAAAEFWVVMIDAIGVGAQVSLSQGCVEKAAMMGLQLVEQARIHGLLDHPHLGYYLATLGAATARSGQLEEGDKLLDAGITQLAEWDLLTAGHARLMRAPVRRQLGDATGARTLVDEAASLLARCPDTGAIGELLPSVARSLSTSHRRGDERTQLTDRELDVLHLLDKALSTREIANELFLSFNTIHSHVKSIYSRLDVSNRRDAIARARTLDLLHPRPAQDNLSSRGPVV